MKKRALTAYILAGVLALGGAAAGAPYAAPYVLPEKPATFEAVVKITFGRHVGTGFSVGNGLVLTAAHVVKGQKNVSLKSTDGRIAGAEVLWFNEARDTALLRTDMKLPAAAIECGGAKTGDDVFTVGNPFGVEFVTAYGKIAGKERAFSSVGSVYVTNMSMVFGQSGGPVFNAAGDVIGLNTMTLIGPIIMDSGASFPTLTGYGFIVPAPDICLLMGRGE